jgi:hypothetical protein
LVADKNSQPRGLANPADLFSNGFSQTAALQIAGDWSTGTHVQTVFRFSPQATVFAIDPFAGAWRSTIPHPVEITQDLPTFICPFELRPSSTPKSFDFQTRTTNGETILEAGTYARSVRGGILVRFD